MKLQWIPFALTAALTTIIAADRSRVVRNEFQRLNLCPANDATRGACPGFEADHVIALCSGGRDELANLEWPTAECDRNVNAAL